MHKKNNFLDIPPRFILTQRWSEIKIVFNHIIKRM